MLWGHNDAALFAKFILSRLWQDGEQGNLVSVRVWATLGLKLMFDGAALGRVINYG
jgi:hypothetical protein